MQCHDGVHDVPNVRIEASPATSSAGSKVTLPAAPGGGATVGQDPDSAGLSCCHHGREAGHPTSAVARTRDERNSREPHRLGLEGRRTEPESRMSQMLILVTPSKLILFNVAREYVRSIAT